MSADSGNPFITPRPRGTRLIQATLRVAVALQCSGLAAGWLHHRRPNSLFNLLAQGQEVSPEQFAPHQFGIASFLIAAGILTLFRPSVVILVPLIVYEMALAISSLFPAEGPIPVLEPALQATRYMVPLALLLVDYWPPKIRPTLFLCLSAVGFLRLGTAAALAAQGLLDMIEYQHGGGLVELVRLTAQNGIRYDLPSELAQRCLAVLGAINLGLALSLLIGRLRFAAALAVVWGLAGAFLWTIALGPAGYDQSLIRITDAAAPLAVLFFWVLAVREQPPIYHPEEADL